jgi:hypothetical protein
VVAPTVAGLSAADLVGIRASLAAGKRPRVVFTPRAGQMAGNLGHIVELTDPTGSDEWIVVQFGRDELPFSPGDLAVSGRQPTAKPTAKPAADSQVLTPAARAAPVPPPRQATVSREENRVPPRRTAATVRPTAEPVPPPVPAPAVAKAPKQPRPPKTPAPLVVTLTYADQRWTVAAQHGSKSLAKPYAITPTEALRMVALVQVPGVHDAVASIIAAERVEAENRAQRLRAELAEIESRLAELSKRQ